MGPTEDLYTFLENTGASYVSLLQKIEGDNHNQGTCFNELCILDKDVKQTVIDPNEEPLLYSEAADHRLARGLADNQQMMVAIAYTFPFEMRQFRLFNAVVHVDATAKTNKEDRPLVTVTGKDSRSKMFTILRAFMPNKRDWAYRWLFKTVFPTLFGKDLLKSVNSFVTDGDSQEIRQIEEAMHQFCPNAIRIRCSWHIIDRGWENHLHCVKKGPTKKHY